MVKTNKKKLHALGQNGFILHINWSLLSTSGLSHFWGKSGKQYRYEKGVFPTCGQSFVPLVPLFVPLLAITSSCSLENTIFLKFTNWVTQTKCGLARFETFAKSYTKFIVYTDNWVNPHYYRFLKRH